MNDLLNDLMEKPVETKKKGVSFVLEVETINRLNAFIVEANSKSETTIFKAETVNAIIKKYLDLVEKKDT